MSIKERVYKRAPLFFQELMISGFNFFAYRKRYGNLYKSWLTKLNVYSKTTLVELRDIQKVRFKEFLKFAINNSKFYASYPIVELSELHKLPIISKETIRKNIRDIYTIGKEKAIVSKTGGTTGKSLEVFFTSEDIQERFAYLDYFRSHFGYNLGEKTAWFSGKSLITKKDLIKNRFWKTDVFYKVRYYSTFHMKEEFLKYYIDNLISYKPKYMVGFPSTMLEIAKFGLKNNYSFPEGIVKAIFPTAETILPSMREVIEKFFGAKVYNQYASSEGAPFVFECKMGKLHMDITSGVFEILDENDLPSSEGRLVLTSFSTRGTPLIRYDIGDQFLLEDEDSFCTCGNNNPLVSRILGRVDDYIYSPQNGKINLGNISNTLKGVEGIVKFQVIQNSLDALEIFIVRDNFRYNKDIEKVFLKNWIDRVGENMKIQLSYVEDISVQKSGKYRIVINNIRHLLD